MMYITKHQMLLLLFFFKFLSLVFRSVFFLTNFVH